MLWGALLSSAYLMTFRFYFILGISSKCRFCHASGQHIREIDRQLLFFSDVFFETEAFDAQTKDHEILQIRGGILRISPPQKMVEQVN